MVRAGFKSLSRGLKPRFPENLRSSCIPAGLGATLGTRLLLAVTLAAGGVCAAQSEGNAIHVLPRSTPVSAAPRGSVLQNVDMVLVNVTVLDAEGRAVNGLEAADFSVVDDKLPQTVRYLSSTDEPVSLVVVLDASGSMSARLGDEQKAFTQLLTASNPQDDFSLIAVGDTPRAMAPWGEGVDGIQKSVSALQSSGETALWDAMMLGLDELKRARHPRKAMIVLSDGGDNHSRYSERALRSRLRESDVQVYAVGLFNRFATRLEEKAGPLQLEEVTAGTGGRVLAVHDAKEMERAVAQISLELRNQYVLGYYPRIIARDGNWHKVKVRVTGPARSRLHLYAKEGYYAPQEEAPLSSR